MVGYATFCLCSRGCGCVFVENVAKINTKTEYSRNSHFRADCRLCMGVGLDVLVCSKGHLPLDLLWPKMNMVETCAALTIRLTSLKVAHHDHSFVTEEEKW